MASFVDLEDTSFVSSVDLYGIMMNYVALYLSVIDWLPNAEEPDLKYVTQIQVAQHLCFGLRFFFFSRLLSNPPFKSHQLIHCTPF